MPWQLKNPTFSFSLRPMLSKHWLVSTFLIWRKEKGEIFLKTFPGPARLVQKTTICEQITFPNSQGTVWVGIGPELIRGHLSLFHVKPWGNSGWLSQICQNLHSFSPCLSQKTTKYPLGKCTLGCCPPLIGTIFPWIWAQEEPSREGRGSFMA